MIYLTLANACNDKLHRQVRITGLGQTQISMGDEYGSRIRPKVTVGSSGVGESQTREDWFRLKVPSRCSSRPVRPRHVDSLVEMHGILGLLLGLECGNSYFSSARVSRLAAHSSASLLAGSDVLRPGMML